MKSEQILNVLRLSISMILFLGGVLSESSFAAVRSSLKDQCSFRCSDGQSAEDLNLNPKSCCATGISICGDRNSYLADCSARAASPKTEDHSLDPLPLPAPAPAPAKP